MFHLPCTGSPTVAILIVVAMAMAMPQAASARRIVADEAGDLATDLSGEAPQASDDKCFKTGGCSRIMLHASQTLTADSGDGSVTLPIYMCATAGRPLNRRSAYTKDRRLKFTKQSGKWTTTDLQDVQYYIKHIFAVMSTAEAIDGAHVVKDSHRPPLDDENTERRGELNTNTAGFFGWTSKSSSQKIGDLSAEELVDAFKAKTNQSNLARFIIDLKKSKKSAGQVSCPALGATGNQAYTSSDNFKLMVFGSGRTCGSLRDDSPPQTEQYCIPFPGLNVRGWAVPIDLAQATPVVRNPALEANRGKAKDHMPASVSPKDLPLFEEYQDRFGDAYCRYLMYSPEQWMSQARPDLLPLARVVINTNFYRFLDVRGLPCGTPVGPVVSAGFAVQTTMRTKADQRQAQEDRQSVFFDSIKTTHVLVLHATYGACIIRSDQFDAWWGGLDLVEKSRINAVTGHRILKNGQPVDDSEGFRSVGQDAFWNQKNARTAVGIQYSMLCPPPLPANTNCGRMLLLLQFEQKKNVRARSVKTFFRNESMDENNRPPSDGVTIPEMQQLLQFLMIDDAINFDGSGSSSLWTSIGNLKEKRSQPADIVQGHPRSGDEYAYAFRPSPIHLAFVPRG